MFVYFRVIFDRHGEKSNNFAAVAMRCTYMSDPVHEKFLILVNVQFVAKIIGMIWNGI